MYPYFMDWTMLLLLPAIVLSFIAQAKVQSTFAKYSGVRASKGVTADAVSRMLLDSFGLQRVRIERIRGNLTDHYDPRDKVLRLSDSVSGAGSIAAIGVAAHEVGHAVQDKDGYAPLRFRNGLVPVANITSTASMPLFFIGLVMGNATLATAGIVLFSGVVLFHLVTLPVELNASARALQLLSNTGTLTPAELGGAKKVLSAAALTYIAAALMGLMQLLRMILIAGAGRRRD